MFEAERQAERNIKVSSVSVLKPTSKCGPLCDAVSAASHYEALKSGSQLHTEGITDPVRGTARRPASSCLVLRTLHRALRRDASHCVAVRCERGLYCRESGSRHLRLYVNKISHGETISPADGSSTGIYQSCNHLANASEAAPATASLPFRPLSVVVRPR